MKRTDSQASAKPRSKPARDPAFDHCKVDPASGNTKAERRSDDELEARVERLEKRLDETIPASDVISPNSAEIDAGDPLRRAVKRSNRKRGGVKN